MHNIRYMHAGMALWILIVTLQAGVSGQKDFAVSIQLVHRPGGFREAPPHTCRPQSRDHIEHLGPIQKGNLAEASCAAMHGDELLPVSEEWSALWWFPHKRGTEGMPTRTAEGKVGKAMARSQNVQTKPYTLNDKFYFLRRSSKGLYPKLSLVAST